MFLLNLFIISNKGIFNMTFSWLKRYWTKKIDLNDLLFFSNINGECCDGLQSDIELTKLLEDFCLNAFIPSVKFLKWPIQQ